ncbi:MAG TPA: 16S rRNA (cytosine(1402)-N(4))-methyltransferase RsmH, partial [Candidatus Goldiibacteriota bacterium]|nr:16S rRNA (cytosine(1402)-N(4))-methyltransferase RsmH [Candidatus Goldiibacteriota bacterium]
MKTGHIPVLAGRAVEYLLAGGEKGVWIDATLGRAGHSMLILQRMPPGSVLIGIDKDEDAIKESAEIIGKRPDFVAVRSAFSSIREIAEQYAPGGVNGVIFDFGVSSPQLDDAQRGFSFMKDAPLDMRMDRSQKLTAYEVVNTYSRERLEKILLEYGEERFASRIAGEIINRRPFKTTLELAEVAERAVRTREKIHPATRLFQAIRMEVNDEVSEISAGLKAAVEVLKPHGRIVAISFHSIEDRLVKRFFAR